MTFGEWFKANYDEHAERETPDREFAEAVWNAALRSGFERGAQWAIMDHAYRTTNFAVVGKDGALPSEERDAHVAQILADLFVPK